MTARPSLVRSIPFWILLVLSLATSAFGAWLAIDKLAVMSAGLTAGTATPVDVYVGQVWAIVGGILLATGIVGLALALVLAVIRSFVPTTDADIIEALDWSTDDEALENAPADEARGDTTAAADAAAVADERPAEEVAAQR